MRSSPRLPTLIVEITQRCNHACLHCYNVWASGSATQPADYPRGELGTADTLALLAKALDETSCRHVTLTGGEPLLRTDLPEILDFLRQRAVTTTVISNGRLLTEPMAIDLLERGVAMFELPLLSHRRKVHDHLSGAPGAFDAVLAAMARLRHQRGQFVAVFVLTRHNVPDLGEAIKLAYAFGARGLMLNRFNPGGRGRRYMHDLLPTAAEVRQALEVAEAAATTLAFPISCSIPIQPCLVDTSAFPHLGFGFCAAGSDRAYYTLDPLGNLRPCNHTPTILGNLREHSFAELIAGERMSEFVGAAPPFCDPCPRRQSCQGGCRASAQVCFGSLTAEDPFLHLARGKGRSVMQPSSM
jgi:radical SAM protein with 4Fe4S-binding SPASM domain